MLAGLLKINSPLQQKFYVTPFSKPKFFNGTFFFSFNLNVKEKQLILDTLILSRVNF